jgi:purine-nucleoside phosphorylase
MSATFVELERSCREAPPDLALVLGSGLGPVAARVAPVATVPYAGVPGMLPSLVPGHRGALTLGTWAGRRVLLFEGRMHFYEGHPWEVVVRKVEVAARLGARALLLTNASGGIREDLGPGTLMLVRDQMECNFPHWWRAVAQPSPYDPAIGSVLARAAETVGISLPAGVYAAVTGPNYETPAEVRALRFWGADAVGMSTTREARRGAELGLVVAAISCVANRAAGLGAEALSHQDVLAVVAATAERLGGLLEVVIARLKVKE